MDLEAHLLHDCEAEKHKYAMIEKSNMRQEVMICSSCGKNVILRALRYHEQCLCENRLVNCRNAHLGCPVLIPLAERKALYPSIPIYTSYLTILYQVICMKM